MRRRIGSLAAVAVVAAGGLFAGLPAAGAVRAADAPAFTKTETITRTHLVAGADQQVDSRTVSVAVSATDKLRDRQEIDVSWSGAHPTGNIYADVNSGAASQEEYPVVILQCRGTDSTGVPAAKQVSPQTCWTSTPLERFQTGAFAFPPYRVDRFESAGDRTATPGQPNPVPSACSGWADTPGTRWVPFVAADGHVYSGGGGSGCAGLPPEAVTVENSLQPSNTTYGVSDLSGNGSAKFVLQTEDTNASLGCSASVACTLEIIPIMGIGCDVAAADLPVDDRPEPGETADLATEKCMQTGAFAPGELAGTGTVNVEDLAVAGQLWWSASNWRNRITVPLHFGQSDSVCSILNTSAPLYVYGSESMTQAALQWAPKFCLDKTLFRFQHVQTSEPQAKNLLDNGGIEAAFQSAPPQLPFSRRVVQAPVAATGFVVAYSVDGTNGKPYPNLKLTPRLLAKLLTESYPSNSTVKGLYGALSGNPSNMAEDPEFQALNPGVPHAITNGEQAAAILALSSDSDVMWALTSYIAADPDAMAWMHGAADPWGMVVNPNYDLSGKAGKDLVLPTASWQLRDSFVPTSWYATGSNPCLLGSKIPWLPLVAAPVSAMSLITLDMQFDIANAQIDCVNAGTQAQKLAAKGRQAPGNRFILGVTSLSDADRYQLATASLLTHVDSDAATTFTDTAGRTFVAPTSSSLRQAVGLMQPSAAAGTWTVPYASLRTSSAGSSAYPGTLLLSMDLPTQGLPALDAKRYATLLRFAVGPGQTPGLDNGQLPAGYLPLTGGNGAAAMVAFSQRAATAVAAQRGDVPLVTGGVSHAPAPPPATSDGSTGSSGGTGGGTDGTGAGSTPTAPAPTPSPSAGSPTPSPTVVAGSELKPLGVTADLGTGAGGLALPVVLALALLGGLAVGLTKALQHRRSRT